MKLRQGGEPLVSNRVSPGGESLGASPEDAVSVDTTPGQVLESVRSNTENGTPTDYANNVSILLGLFRIYIVVPAGLGILNTYYNVLATCHMVSRPIYYKNG